MKVVPSLQATGPIIVVNNLVRYLKDIVEKVDVYYFDELPAMQFDCRTIQIRMGEKIDFDAYDIIHSHCLRPDKYLVKWKKYIHKAKIVTNTSRYFSKSEIPIQLFACIWCD